MSTDKIEADKSKARPVTSILGAEVKIVETSAWEFLPPANPKGNYNPPPRGAAVKQLPPAEAKQLLQKPKRAQAPAAAARAPAAAARAPAAAARAPVAAAGAPAGAEEAEDYEVQHLQNLSSLQSQVAALKQELRATAPSKLSPVYYTPEHKKQGEADLARRRIKAQQIQQQLKSAEAELSAQAPKGGLRIQIPDVRHPKAPAAAVDGTTHQDADVSVSLQGAAAAVGAVQGLGGSSSNPTGQGLQLHAANGNTHQEDSAAVPPAPKRLKNTAGEGVTSKTSEQTSGALEDALLKVKDIFPGSNPNKKPQSSAAAAAAAAAAGPPEPTAEAEEEEPYKVTEQLTPRTSCHTEEQLDYEDSDYEDQGHTPRCPAETPEPEQEAPAAAAAATAAAPQVPANELEAELEATKAAYTKLENRHNLYLKTKLHQLNSKKEELKHKQEELKQKQRQLSNLQAESALKDQLIQQLRELLKQQREDAVPKCELEALQQKVTKKNKELTDQQLLIKELQHFKDQQQRADTVPKSQLVHLEDTLKSQARQFKEKLEPLQEEASHLERSLLDLQLSSSKKLDSLRRELHSVGRAYGDLKRSTGRPILVKRGNHTDTYLRYFLFKDTTAEESKDLRASEHPQHKGYYDCFQGQIAVTKGIAY